jgi:RES domain-containing protein
MLVWRLQRSVHSALTGEGARLYGGRWNSPGRPVVYTSDSLALSVLEMLVHLDSDLVPADYASYMIDIPDDLRTAEVVRGDLPAGWNRSITCRECVQIGENWLERGETAVLIVPSAVGTHGNNVLIDPRHDFARSISVRSEDPFDFDPRLR